MLRLLSIFLVGCASDAVPRDWTVQGAPVQARWEVVVEVALEMSPCGTNGAHEIITFRPAPFACYPRYDESPLCNGMTTYHAIQVNGAQTPDVTLGTLPYEAANTIAQICWGESDEPPRMQALAVEIAAEARRRIEAP